MGNEKLKSACQSFLLSLQSLKMEVLKGFKWNESIDRYEGKWGEVQSTRTITLTSEFIELLPTCKLSSVKHNYLSIEGLSDKYRKLKEDIKSKCVVQEQQLYCQYCWR